MIGRRSFAAGGLFAAAAANLAAAPKPRVTGFELIPVRATGRSVWLIVRLTAEQGLSGLGEASDAFGYARTSKQDALRMEALLRRFFELANGRSPLDIEAYRQKAEPIAAAGGLIAATAYSAIEQALWDLAGKALGLPTYGLLGGKLRDGLNYDAIHDELEGKLLFTLLPRYEGKPTLLARALDMNRATLRKKLRQAGLSDDEA